MHRMMKNDGASVRGAPGMMVDPARGGVGRGERVPPATCGGKL